MALDFPASPTNGQVFSSGGVSWTFDGDKWKVSSAGIEPVFISSSTPTGVAGQIYWDSDESTAYIYYDDGNTAQWVPLTSTAPVSFDTSAIVSGTLPVARGGTGITVYGSAGQVLTSNGSNNNPSWQDASGGGSYDFVASGAIANGDTVIVNANGTVSVVSQTGSADPNAGTPAVFESAAAYDIATVYDSVNQKVVIAYRDNGNSNYGTAVVGTVSGNSITFGTPVVFETGTAVNIAAVYDPTNEKIVIAFEDSSSLEYGKAIVGTVSGDSISFGTAATFESAAVHWISAAYDSTSGKIIIAYQDKGNSSYGTAVVGSVSGTSITFGTPVVFKSASATYIKVVYDSTNDKTVIIYNVGGSLGGEAVVGTVSGTSISFGTATIFNTGSTNHVGAAFDSTNDKVVIAYRDQANNNYGYAIVGTVSSTSISFGTEVAYATNGDTRYNTVTHDPVQGVTVIAYEDLGNAQYGTAITGTVSGTSISFGNTVIFESAAMDYTASTYDSTNGKIVIAYQDDGNSLYGTAVVLNSTTYVTNVTTENYIGIAAEAISDTATGKINIIGGVNEGQTGLTAGQTYYVQGDGSLGLNPAVPSVVAGTAISATKLIVKG